MSSVLGHRILEKQGVCPLVAQIELLYNQEGNKVMSQFAVEKDLEEHLLYSRSRRTSLAFKTPHHFFVFSVPFRDGVQS